MHPPLSVILALFLLLQPLVSPSNLHKIKLLASESELLSQPASLNHTQPPTLYFEVTKPIRFPSTKPFSNHILHHDFGYTYGKPPILANYYPPSDFLSRNFSMIVLEWRATCQGRQFDRIFGVWLGGVEILRSCTAEPRANGIVYTVKKDITRYYSLLMKKQTLAVYLGNLVDKTYTGVYHVDITIHFYPSQEKLDDPQSRSDHLKSRYGSSADLILPISRNLPLNDGLWFEIENTTDTALEEFRIPQNAYRAVLEVYVSFHENDEFWSTNLPNEYIAANNITGMPGNGPFREVEVSLDGKTIGAVWPFMVIFTGGVNPLLWRPITGIGSFDLPSYDIEITPFLGNILDGKIHKFAFSVTNALNVWYVDANLHLWLDHESTRTEGKLLKHVPLPLVESLVSDFEGFNGTFLTSARRSILSIGWIKSSHGYIITHSVQNFSYSNKMVMGNDGNMQIVNQTIHFNDSVSTKMPSSNLHFRRSCKTFPFYIYTDYTDQGNVTSLSIANLKLEFDEKRYENFGRKFSKTSLKNVQNGQGSMVVKNNLVVSGLGSTQQVYKFDSGDLCYFRNVSSSNYTILYDEVTDSCSERRKSQLGFRNLHFPSISV